MVDWVVIVRGSDCMSVCSTVRRTMYSRAAGDGSELCTIECNMDVNDGGRIIEYVGQQKRRAWRAWAHRGYGGTRSENQPISVRQD